ncbi:MAG: T9SS type A sorting domain-containing protein [Bacteroidales bacterium]|nr:T9SS type A sorting domain-containing protein [Bacteroidales bacterium]MCK5338991.1 T9SS type A sorting domain-containing protein [Bacteroidales bacterium]
MQYKKLLLSAILLTGLGLAGLQAQEAVLAAGGDGSGSGGSISHSVGQVTYTTSTGTNGYSVAEGVQQPYEISVIIGVEEDIGLKLECQAYPNPAKDHLTLKIDASTSLSIQSMEYRLYDMQGNLLENKKLTGKETTISMEKLVPASYFLKITDNQKEMKIFKIIKN